MLPSEEWSRRTGTGGNFSDFSCILLVNPMSDDSQLIAETLAGDTAAFGQLVQKYQDRLYNTVLHITGGAAGAAEDSRDIVQEAFVQAFLKLDTFQQNSAFYTWLYRIAFNVAASHRRRRKPAVSVDFVHETTGQQPVDSRPGPEQRMEEAERRRQIEQAIAALSEEHRAVLVLREIDGCCYETISEILGLPIGTVRSRLHRARLQLREQLREVLILED